MQRFWDVASPMTWVILSLASVFLLAGFTLLSHTLVRSKAYGDRYRGLLHPGAMEWTVRLGIASLALGGALTAYELSAPVWLTLAAGAMAVALITMQGVAMVRGGAGS